MSEPPFGAYQPTAFQGRLIRWGRGLPANKLGKRAASLIRSYFARTARRPIDVTTLGQNMRLHPWDNACEKRLLVTPQFFDPTELAFIKSRLHPKFTLVDIGSNVGAYSIFVARNGGETARVVAIDPNERVLSRLRFNAKANDLQNIVPICAAVGDRAGTVSLRIGKRNMGGSSVHAEKRLGQDSETVEVPMKTLASIVAEAKLEQIDLLKIDIEGYEDLALIPFFASAEQSLLPRALIIECNVKDWREDLFAAAERRGYRDSGLSGINAILVLDEDGTS